MKNEKNMRFALANAILENWADELDQQDDAIEATRIRNISTLMIKVRDDSITDDEWDVIDDFWATCKDEIDKMTGVGIKSFSNSVSDSLKAEAVLQQLHLELCVVVSVIEELMATVQVDCLTEILGGNAFSEIVFFV